jgi:hypothetical protein
VTTEFRRRTLGDRHFADQAVTSPTKLPISVFIHDEAINAAERTTVNKRARSRCFGRCRRASASILSVVESRSTARSAARDRATNQRNWAASAPNELPGALPGREATGSSAYRRISRDADPTPTEHRPPFWRYDSPRDRLGSITASTAYHGTQGCPQKKNTEVLPGDRASVMMLAAPAACHSRARLNGAQGSASGCLGVQHGR